MEQCPRCNELWRACAVATSEAARLAEEADRPFLRSRALVHRDLHAAHVERAASEVKIRIHMFLAHGHPCALMDTSERTMTAGGHVI